MSNVLVKVVCATTDEVQADFFTKDMAITADYNLWGKLSQGQCNKVFSKLDGMFLIKEEDIRKHLQSNSKEYYFCLFEADSNRQIQIIGQSS